MLQAVNTKDYEITSCKVTDESVAFESGEGTLLLRFYEGEAVRISFDPKGGFSTEQAPFLVTGPDMFDGNVTEDKFDYKVTFGKLTVSVLKKNGAVTVIKDDTIIYHESYSRVREINAYDALRLKAGGNIDTVDIETADGIKKKVVSAEKEFYKTLYRTKVHFSFAPDEKIFGLGQYDEGVWDYRNTTRYIHQANKQIAIPMFISSKGYGLMFTTMSPAIFSDSVYGSYFHTEADLFIDYFVIAPDSFENIISVMRALTGKASMLPKYALRYVQSKERYETEEEILSAAAGFKDRNIDLGLIVLDWMSWEDGMWGQKTFDPNRFPDVEGMVSKLHSMNTHFMLSIWPSMAECSENHKEMRRKGMLLPGTNVYNAFDKDARNIYWKQTDVGLASRGVESFWCDSSEPITPEWGYKYEPLPEEKYSEYVKTANDSLYIDKGNAYGYYHALGLYEGFRRTYPGTRVLNLTRSGYFGSQSLGVTVWSGDISASFAELKRQIVAGQSIAMTGIPHWTMDAGAFFVKKGDDWYWNGDYENPESNKGYWELYTRWIQTSAFLPMFRSHGTDINREPWNFGDEGERFYDAIVSAISLRRKLLPYFYSLEAAVSLEDRMFIKPLFFINPEDKECYEAKYQFMCGDELMVCPVTEPLYYDNEGNFIQGKTVTSVYLPAGTDWYDFNTGKRYQGGRRVEVSASIDRIPVFVKAGSIIPTEEAGTLTINIYTGANGNFKMYDDDGISYGYENGEYCIHEFIWNDKKKKCDVRMIGDYPVSFENVEYNIVS